MKYYVAEVENKNSFRRAVEVEAENLTQAKRKASKMQMFENTVMEIATSVNSAGYIMRPVAQKVMGLWMDYEVR